MKKLTSLALILAFIVCLSGIHSFASGESVKVYVTIANGSLVVTQKEITVTDVDGDSSLSLNDALYLAHESFYEGGAAAGYSTEETAYGLSITKFWGIENGGSYGYYLNNSMASGLTETLKDGDYVNAFVFTDTSSFSDLYCYFNVNTVTSSAGQDVSLTLTSAGFDENWSPVLSPVKNAVITIDGVSTEYKTDSEGKATFTISNPGSHIISAISDTQNLVPPVCIAEVSASTPETSDGADYVIYAILGSLALAIVTLAFRRRCSYEK